MEVEKLKYFISIFLYNSEDTVSNFDKGMFRKDSFRGTSSYSSAKTKYKSVVICFQVSNRVFFLTFVLF